MTTFTYRQRWKRWESNLKLAEYVKTKSKFMCCHVAAAYGVGSVRIPNGIKKYSMQNAVPNALTLHTRCLQLSPDWTKTCRDLQNKLVAVYSWVYPLSNTNTCSLESLKKVTGFLSFCKYVSPLKPKDIQGSFFLKLTRLLWPTLNQFTAAPILQILKGQILKNKKTKMSHAVCWTSPRRTNLICKKCANPLPSR